MYLGKSRTYLLKGWKNAAKYTIINNNKLWRLNMNLVIKTKQDDVIMEVESKEKGYEIIKELEKRDKEEGHYKKNFYTVEYCMLI